MNRIICFVINIYYIYLFLSMSTQLLFVRKNLFKTQNVLFLTYIITKNIWPNILIFSYIMARHNRAKMPKLKN